MVADLARDLGRGGADGDEGDAGLLEEGAGGEHRVGVRVADEGLDLVLLDVLLRGLGRDGHVVLAVVDEASRAG